MACGVMTRMKPKVLFIGGTGIISSACTTLALEKGLDLYLLNRGTSHCATPEGVKTLHADIRDPQSVRTALGEHYFDSIVDWIAFTPQHIQTDIDLFAGRTNQFLFISSASVYQKPISNLPITESTLAANPYWGYSRDKIACEELLIRAYRDSGFPMTIVRPSHTYDQTLLPMTGGYTVIDRMRQGKKVIVHGDGTSLWVMTHHHDFAKGFVGLLGNYRTLGETFHITSDETVTWNQIHQMFAAAAGTEAKIVHVPSETLAVFPQMGGEGLLGDKTHSVIFDNSKIKRFVPDFAATIPLSWGAKEVLAWYDADLARRTIDEEFNQLTDQIIAAQESIRP